MKKILIAFACLSLISCVATKPRESFTNHLSYVSTLISYNRVPGQRKGTYAFIFRNRQGVQDTCNRSLIYKSKSLFSVGSKYMLYLDTVARRCRVELVN